MHEGSVPVVVVGTAGEAHLPLLRLSDSGHANVHLIQAERSHQSRASEPGFFIVN